MNSEHNTFDYVSHYKKDSEEFDYFEERLEPARDEEKRVRQVILSQIPKNSDLILDVGCGSGWIARHFIPQNKKVISLDISKTNPARVHNIVQSQNHFPIVADSLRLPFKDNMFSCVVASEVIEHTVSPEKFFAELFRVLTKNGRIIISTPYKEKLRYHLCIHCNKKTPENAHIHSFDEDKLAGLYNEKDLRRFNPIIFGNKALIFLRTYILLKHLPLNLWLAVDWLANKIYDKPLHLVCSYEKN